MWNSNTAQAGAVCQPRWRFRSGAASSSMLEVQEHVKGKYYLTARPGRSRRRLLSAQEQSAQPRQRCCLRPGAPSEEPGTMGQFFSSHAIYSYPTIVYFTAGVAGVFSALHHMWKAWSACIGKQKKSVGSWFDAESAPLGGELS